MSTRRTKSPFLPTTVSGAIALSLFASSVLAADRPPPMGARNVPVPGGIALVGYGKGRVAMPMVSEDGRMFGTLADADGNELFHIDAMLSGCMPSVPFGLDSITFGGLYGSVRKLVDADPAFQPRTILYEVDGTWVLEGRDRGSFSAIAYDLLDSGRRVIAGKLYGEFQFAGSGSLGLTVPLDDRAIPGKGSKTPFGGVRLADPYGDAKPRPGKGGGKSAVGDVRKVRAGDAFGDGKTAPRKGGKTVVDDSRSKRVVDPLGDGKSAHKGGGKSPVDDAAGRPSDPILGSFVLRYVFVR